MTGRGRKVGGDRRSLVSGADAPHAATSGRPGCMKPWLSRYDHTVDNIFEDKVILPGLIEPHSRLWRKPALLHIQLEIWGPLTGAFAGSPKYP